MSKYLLLQSDSNIVVSYDDITQKTDSFEECDITNIQQYDFILKFDNQVTKRFDNLCEKKFDDLLKKKSHKTFYRYQTTNRNKKLYIIETESGDCLVFKNYKDVKYAVETLYEE